MHQDHLLRWFGEKNLQEHQSGRVVEGEKKWEKTKIQAFMKVVYNLCEKNKDPCMLIYIRQVGV
jgi:hypothetical protein